MVELCLYYGHLGENEAKKSYYREVCAKSGIKTIPDLAHTLLLQVESNCPLTVHYEVVTTASTSVNTNFVSQTVVHTTHNFFIQNGK